MGMSVELIIFVVLMVLALFTGRIVDFNHTRSLKEREAKTAHVLIHNLRSFPEHIPQSRTPTIINAEVVIATDYFKNFVSSLRQFFGGEMHAYGFLMMRARREVTLRLKEQALSEGYNAVANVRFYTVDIGSAQGARQGVVMVSMLACGTAYRSEQLMSLSVRRRSRA